MIQEQRKELNLTVGDKAYLIYDHYGQPDIVTITGECEEGRGYTAYSPFFARDHEGDGAIHTCNGFLAKSKTIARKESLRILRILHKDLKKEQSRLNQAAQYIDYVFSKKGRI
jgi:hypothetical protein